MSSSTGHEKSPGPFGERHVVDSARIETARKLAARIGGIPALDRLSALAARLIGAESAQVSIIHDEQAVMGGSGVASASVGIRSAAADSLCTVTVRAATALAVPDAAHDPRVSSLPPVTSGVVGAYLGVPLRSGDHVIGALCVFDSAPRAWSETDISLLEDLTTATMAELELAALEVSYEDDRRTWQLGIDAARVGVFDWDLLSGDLRWDDRLLELFGVDRTTFGGDIEAFNALVHPDDRDRVGLTLGRAVEDGTSFESDYRVVWPDGTVRWISARGETVLGPDGATCRLLGAAHDTTAVREAETRVARALEAMPIGCLHLDHEWRFTFANPEAAKLLGSASPDVTGHVVWELFPAAVGSDFEHYYRTAVATQEPTAFEAYYPPPLDAWLEVRCWPVSDGLSVYFIDVTHRHRAQEVLEAAARADALLVAVTQALSSTLDVDEAVTRLARVMAPDLADWCVVTLVDGAIRPGSTLDDGWRHRLRDLGWWHEDPASRQLVDRYVRVRASALGEDSLVARALHSGRTEVVHATTEQFCEQIEPGPGRDVFRQLAPTSVAVVPLHGRGRVAGLISLYRSAVRPAFDDDDLDLLGDVAGRAGLALDNARAYAGQRELAEAMQHILLTRPPEVDGLEIVVRYQPAAETAQVGGDWYDAFLLPDGALALVIGDVIGHDTAAAAAMGQVRGLVRGIAATTGEGPADVVRRVDGAIALLDLDTLATGVVARLEPADDSRPARLRWSNAAHPPPLVVAPTVSPRAAGAGAAPQLLWAEQANTMLGLLDQDERAEDVVRHETVVPLPDGATVLLYTDGLVERRGSTIDDGLERLRRLLVELVDRELPLDRLCDELLARLLPVWTEDDVALIAVRLRPVAGTDER